MGFETVLDSELKKRAYEGELIVSVCFLCIVPISIIFSYVVYNRIISETPLFNLGVVPMMAWGLARALELTIVLLIWSALNLVQACCDALDKRDDKKEWMIVSQGVEQ